MGFITTMSRSGREVFACEIGAEGCDTTGCKAHRCPFGYCQRYYVCRSCWSRPEVKAMFTKAGGKHENCRVNSEAYHAKQAEAQAIVASGKMLRVSAYGLDGDCVHVIFRGAGGVEAGRYMTHAVYDAIPLGVNATIEDYEAKAGSVLPEAPTEFAHTGNSSKEVAFK